MFQQILVPLDGSVRAEQALPVAARLARACGGSLLLVQVVDPPLDYSGGFAPIPMMTGDILTSEMDSASDYLTMVAARSLLAGIQITTEVLYGFAARQLSEAATAHGSDLIVMCSHGRTGFTRWALGSVAHTLVHQSRVPLLVLRQEAMLAQGEAERPFCTLVPLDGSALAESALTPALALTEALAAAGRGALRLVQVIEPVRGVREEEAASETNDKERQMAYSYLATAATRAESQMTGQKLVLVPMVEAASDVAAALLSVAEREEPSTCDVIAISTHGRHGLERWVMGSVTERLLTATRLPMLIVRPHHQQ